MSSNATTENVTLHICDDCGDIMSNHRLREICMLKERVDPGHLVPSGECPHCLSLCYPLEPQGDMKRIQAAATLTLEILKFDGNTDVSKVLAAREALRHIKRIVERDEA